MDVVLARRPEIGAGGIARDDSAFQFYARINAIVAPEHSVLDLGAGRGAQFDGAASWKKAMTTLRGKVKRVAGCDVDPIVLTNPYVDDASLIGADGKLPYEDGTFDLVYCDWVLEHVEDVAPFVAEVDRVLKPGGWFCARTPNKWGYVALAARTLPQFLERRVLHFAQPNRLEHDVFPKHYRLNTLGAIRRAFPHDRWRDCSFSTSSTPSYHGGKQLLFDLMDWFQRLTPAAVDTVLLVFMQKHEMATVVQPTASSATHHKAKA
jgi:SAM-dependent methyltransferase